jgi:hypothetical protein
MEPIMRLNYLAMVVSAIVSMILGMVWYGPLFGKKWMALSGMTDKDMEKAKKKGMAKSYVAAFIASIIMAYVVAHIVSYAQATTLADGVLVGFWSWLGFVATTMLGVVLWEGKSKEYYLINAGYHLIQLVLMGVILTLWLY